jgi:hypothetical protein
MKWEDEHEGLEGSAICMYGLRRVTKTVKISDSRLENRTGHLLT